MADPSDPEFRTFNISYLGMGGVFKVAVLVIVGTIPEVPKRSISQSGRVAWVLSISLNRTY